MTHKATIHPSADTFRVSARPTFLEGMARVFDFANLLQRHRADAHELEADTNAIMSDWIAVGEDIRRAIRTYERHHTAARAQ